MKIATKVPGLKGKLTMLHILETRAAADPEKIAFTFHQDLPCTYGALWQEINRVGHVLREQGLPHQEPVIIAVPNSNQFFYAFYGVQYAGGIAVPVFPASGAERIIKLAHLCRSRYIIVSEKFPPNKIDDLKQQATENHLQILWLEQDFHLGQAECSPVAVSLPQISPQDISFIQFTSGSTSESKGVQLTHANIITNLEQMIAGMEITTADIFVSWLPVYHDMGLILMSMVPFFLGIPLTLLPTGMIWLKTWLKCIEEQKATFTAAPDFAYRWCLLYIGGNESFDISSLRVALNAAEPVRSSTIARFEARFRLENVMLPAYGLAEATVGVCCGKPGKKVKIDSRGFVSVGTPFPEVQMQISKNNRPAPCGKIGEIFVQSSANTKGYFRNPRATKKLFNKHGYIRTGDLGYRDEDGDYFITGRKKNIIIQGGFNIYAQEVEEMVDGLPFVRRSAAVGLDRGSREGEQLYIFIEVKVETSQEQDQNFLTGLAVQVVQRCEEVLGLRPGRVFLLKHGAVPMTYNGKIKYPLLKDLYSKGALKRKGLILFPDFS